MDVTAKADDPEPLKKGCGSRSTLKSTSLIQIQDAKNDEKIPVLA